MCVHDFLRSAERLFVFTWEYVVFNEDDTDHTLRTIMF